MTPQSPGEWLVLIMTGVVLVLIGYLALIMYLLLLGGRA